MSALESRFQDNIRKGYPYTVMDMESGEVLAKFNLYNVKPSESQMNAMARSLLDAFRKWEKRPEDQK